MGTTGGYMTPDHDRIGVIWRYMTPDHDRIGVMWRYMTPVHDRIGVIWVLPGGIWPWLGLHRASKPPIGALYSPRRYIQGPRMHPILC